MNKLMYEIKDWKDLKFEGSTDFLEALMKKEGSSLYTKIIEILNQAITTKKPEVVIMKLEDLVLPKLITVNDHEYKSVLETINSYCLSIEDYETCVTIRDILQNFE